MPKDLVGKSRNMCGENSVNDDGFILQSQVVDRYKEKVKRLRNAKNRGKLDENEIFYGRDRVRENAFEGMGDSKSAETSRPSTSSAKTRLQHKTAKNRSGRRVKTDGDANGAVVHLHVTNYLLNAGNPDMTQPLSVKSLSRKIETPNRLRSVKLRRQSKKSKRRLDRMSKKRQATSLPASTVAEPVVEATGSSSRSTSL